LFPKVLRLPVPPEAADEEGERAEMERRQVERGEMLQEAARAHAAAEPRRRTFLRIAR